MLIAIAIAVGLVVVPSALAHGPCGSCLNVSSGPPGTRVRIVHTTAYRVVWNGPGLPQDGALRPHYRPDTQTIDLVDLAPQGLPSLGSVAPDVIPEARRGVEFRVPNVPQGRYPVVIYDGSEGGEHYTWDPFTVTGRPAGPARWATAALVAVGFIVLAALLYGARRSISQPSPSRR